MKKLSSKILLALFGIFFIVSALGRIIVYIFDLNPLTPVIMHEYIFIGILIIGFFFMILFGLAVNHIILKRIRLLNHAVKEIESGHFDFQVEVDGKDEISALMSNLNKMTKELQANEYLSKEFARNVSHEFKTPLSSIKGYAELIENGSLSEEDRVEYSGIIIHEIDRLSKLSKNLLQISLLDSSNLIKQDEEYFIDEQIRSVLQLTQLEWESKNIEFDLILDEILYVGNKDLTFQIWQNLISNAIKFSKDNSIIRISLKKESDISFEIQDYGLGISFEDQSKIFNQFFIANKSRNKSGSGLGLSITKKIVEKLGGSICFESVENEGTTFHVKLL
jgi:signal transduction histidine kinase